MAVRLFESSYHLWDELYRLTPNLECMDNLKADEYKEHTVYFEKEYIELVFKEDHYLVNFPDFICTDEKGQGWEEIIQMKIKIESFKIEVIHSNSGMTDISLSLLAFLVERNNLFLKVLEDEIKEYVTERRKILIDGIVTD